MATRVFISYSHDSEEHKDRVWDLSERLRKAGIECRNDQQISWPKEGWPRWCKNELEQAEFCLLVFTQQYRRKYEGKLKGGGNFEGFIVTQEIYKSGNLNARFIPIVFEDSDIQHLPIEFEGYPHFNVSIDTEYTNLFFILAGIQRRQASQVGQLQELLTSQSRDSLSGQSENSDQRNLDLSIFESSPNKNLISPSSAAIVYIHITAPDGDDRALRLIKNLSVDATKREVIGKDILVLFDSPPDPMRKAARMAESCILRAEREVLRGLGPRFHIRIGIAAGEISTLSPFEGAVYVEANNLCQLANEDEILVSASLRSSSGLPAHRFRATRWENCFEYRTIRLIRSAPTDFFGNGLVRLYHDRRALTHDFPPARLIDLAASNSTVLVAGRTLIFWTSLVSEIKDAVQRRNVKFQMLVSSPESCEVLNPHEQEDVRTDLIRSVSAFRELNSSLSTEEGTFEVRETDQAVVDGVTCARVVLPGEEELSRQTLLVIFDVNAALGEKKPALLFACSEQSETCSCMAHGLFRRTLYRFEKARLLRLEAKSDSGFLPPMPEGLVSRNNRIEDYLPRLQPYFEAVQSTDANKDDEPPSFPPPFCVQLQISGKCSTSCGMCDHYKEQSDGLSTENWEKIFKDLADFGVGACIFSGGEPLMRKDITRLLRTAKRQRLSIGLLTNGTSPPEYSDLFRDELFEAIYECVSWVAVSVDGLPDDDAHIRRPNMGEKFRIERLQEFSRYFRKRFNDEHKFRNFLTATVTLQRRNIDSDLRLLIKFVNETLGIAQVNFKLATGGQEFVEIEPAKAFLPTPEQIQSFRNFLWNSDLSEQGDNNLGYLRRCFAEGIFNEIDATEGVPLRTYYKRNRPRCFAPLISSLIDLQGNVYPCCHLYRDNHGMNPKSKPFRQRFNLGNAVISTFQQIWCAAQYQKVRKELREIKPENHYAPCGECTRYCQHNIAINRLFRAYARDPITFSFGSSKGQPSWI